MDYDGRTVAFLCSVIKHKIPPKEWEHDPNIVCFNKSYSVAMSLASCGIDPPK